MSEDTQALENALQESLNLDQGEANQQVEASDASDIPAEYAGKSQAELAKMLQETQSMIGRQSAEVGEMRRFTEQLMARENERLATQESAQAAPEVSWNDENPLESIQSVVNNTVSKQLKGFEEQLAKLNQFTARQELSSAHSDWQDVVNGQEFQSFAVATPIRQELYQRANNGDVAAASELLGTFKELRGATKVEPSQTATSVAASLESSNPAVTRAASGKPILRRGDIQKLASTNPKRYRELLPEIRQAYLEGRVK